MNLKRGCRFIIDDCEYAVTHIKVDGKRGEISLISLDEALRRYSDLADLLNPTRTTDSNQHRRNK